MHAECKMREQSVFSRENVKNDARGTEFLIILN
jgi:hypothetical protein